MIVIIGIKTFAPVSFIELIMLVRLEPFKDVVRNCSLLNSKKSIPKDFRTLVIEWSFKIYLNHYYSMVSPLYIGPRTLSETGG